MKKTLLALVVATAAATSANAVTVYEQNGTKVDLSGSFRVLLGRLADDQRGDLINDGSRLKVNASHDLGNGLKALGGFELRFDNIEGYDNLSKEEQKSAKATTTFRNLRARQVYAGLSHEDVGTLTFGRQATTLDDVSLSDFTYKFGGNGNLKDYAEKSAKFKSAEWSGFSFGLDYLFGNANKDREPGNHNGGYKHGYGVSAFYTNKFTDALELNLAAGYGVDLKDDNTTTSVTAKDVAWRTSAQIVYADLSFGAEYGQTVHKKQDEKTSTDRAVLVSGKYQIIEPTAVYAQWLNDQTKDHVTDGKEKTNTYIAGVDYKFNKNVVTFVEYAKANTKDASGEKTKDSKFGVGLRIHF